MDISKAYPQTHNTGAREDRNAYAHASATHQKKKNANATFEERECVRTHLATRAGPEPSGEGLTSIVLAAPIISVAAETRDMAAACIGLM